ncbi:MAG: hypothetical protein JO336_04895 [Acidobacteriia bacterium]|nr:hypothetical protein [Terriglobia bacterium]MBV8904511.1 hypothetical protein [Terriglobia bacterium]
MARTKNAIARCTRPFLGIEVPSRSGTRWPPKIKLRHENQRLEEDLEKAHIIINVKKVAELLGNPIAEAKKS